MTSDLFCQTGYGRAPSSLWRSAMSVIFNTFHWSLNTGIVYTWWHVCYAFHEWTRIFISDPLTDDVSTPHQISHLWSMYIQFNTAESLARALSCRLLELLIWVLISPMRRLFSEVLCIWRGTTFSGPLTYLWRTSWIAHCQVPKEMIGYRSLRMSFFGCDVGYRTWQRQRW